MPWRPSTDPAIQSPLHNKLWDAIESIFDQATPPDPIPRGDEDKLRNAYIRKRKFDTPHTKEKLSQLPDSITRFGIGPTDADLLDFLLNYSHGRVLRIVGPRGAGKSTLIHFAEEVIKKSGLEPCPVIVIVDGLMLESGATLKDFARLLLDKFKRRTDTLTGELRDGFAGAAKALGESTDRFGLINAVKELSQRLPNSDKRLVTFVFDNLDQHEREIIEVAVEVARLIYMSSQLGTIVCMRPGIGKLVNRASAARAFFSYTIKLEAPSADAWLEGLSDSMGRILAQQYERGAGKISIYDRELEPNQLKEAIEKFRDLLLSRRVEDSVIQVLEEVSANDTRHFVRLVRRLLSNRHLPDRWLLGIDDSPLEFHPIPSLMQGPRVLYEYSKEIPNLLYYGDGHSNSDLLLIHRILVLLNSSPNAIKTERLVKWIEQFQSYDFDSILECLSYLVECHLVGCSDGEIINRKDPSPSEFFLTSAGHYYLNKLLHLTDYLAEVVLDVPLEHKMIQQEYTDTFPGKLSSLLEYAEDVRYREERQIANLVKKKPAPELRRVAEALSKGSLLSSSIADALSDVIDRGRRARSASLQNVLGRAEEVHKGLRGWIDSAEQRLKDAANRGRKVGIKTTTKKIVQSQGIEVRIAETIVGDDIQTTVDVITPKGMRSNFVKLTFTDEAEKVVVQSSSMLNEVTPSNSAGQGGTYTCSFPDLVNQIDVSTVSETLSVQLVSVPQSLGRVGLLTVDQSAEAAKVRLYVPQTNDCFEIGEIRDMSMFAQWSLDQLRKLSARLVRDLSYEDQLGLLGVELCSSILGVDGQNILVAHFKLLDTIVVCCDRPEIPWEFLCPPPQPTEQLLPAIGQRWRIYRWPSDPVLAGLLAVRISETPGTCGSVCTFGLPLDATKPWRHPLPNSLAELNQEVIKHDTIHFVGHWNENQLSFVNSDLRLDATAVRAFGFAGPRNIVVSACSAAATSIDTSLPVALSLQSTAKRVVWSPVVFLREKDGEELDNAMISFIHNNPSSSIDEFFRTMRTRLPLLFLYVQYGLST